MLCIQLRLFWSGCCLYGEEDVVSLVHIRNVCIVFLLFSQRVPVTFPQTSNCIYTEEGKGVLVVATAFFSKEERNLRSFKVNDATVSQLWRGLLFSLRSAWWVALYRPCSRCTVIWIMSVWVLVWTMWGTRKTASMCLFFPQVSSQDSRE